MNKITNATSEYLKEDLPAFRSGDTINVGVRVMEGEKSRIQNFEGVVISISSGGGMDKTFTIRKISNGVGVERIFPIHSPNIDSIKVTKKGKVRRAKLYYLRNRTGKSARIAKKIKKKIGIDVEAKSEIKSDKEQSAEDQNESSVKLSEQKIKKTKEENIKKEKKSVKEKK